MPPIHVDGVAKALEREETNAHRQEDIPWLEVVFQHTLHHSNEEIGVLKIAQQAQVDDDAQCNEQLSQPPTLAIAVYEVG